MSRAESSCCSPCPQCGGDGTYLNVRRTHWGTCTACGVKWLIGINLFSSWQEEAAEDWRRNAELLETFAPARPTVPPTQQPKTTEEVEQAAESLHFLLW